jgi:hypothetical protein
MDTKNKMYAKFMQDMMKLSLEYPFIQKVVVSKGAYELTCNHLDDITQQEHGAVQKHIEQNPETGCVKFENIYIVPSEELK